jgi:predicted nuclease of restriction endonuclease-like (RecB) superfamily
LEARQAAVTLHMAFPLHAKFYFIDSELERSFYCQQNIIENWNVRELRRQKYSGLFLRTAASKDKKGAETCHKSPNNRKS